MKIATSVANEWHYKNKKTKNNSHVSHFLLYAMKMLSNWEICNYYITHYTLHSEYLLLLEVAFEMREKVMSPTEKRPWNETILWAIIIFFYSFHLGHIIRCKAHWSNSGKQNLGQNLNWSCQLWPVATFCCDIYLMTWWWHQRILWQVASICMKFA